MLRIFYEPNLGHAVGNITETKFKYKPKNTGVDVS